MASILKRTSFTIANKSPEWHKAMEEEYYTLIKKKHMVFGTSGT